MDGLYSLLDCSPPWMSCFSRRPPPRVTSYPYKVQCSLLLLGTAAGCSRHQAQGFCAACIDVQAVNVGNSGIKFSSKAGNSYQNQPL